MRWGGAFMLGVGIAYAMAGACGSDDSSPSSATGGGASVTSGASGAGGLLGDDSGALYVAASLQPSSPVDLGGGELAAGKGIVLFKLNPGHQHVWSRRIGANTSIDGVATFSFAQNGDLLLGGTTGFQTDRRVTV